MVGWGWHEGDPATEAALAVNLCRRYDLDGYIANCEDAYEFSGVWRSQVFVGEFRRLAPRAPLALSHIGEGYPYRMLDWTPWVRAGAAFMPQVYWNTGPTPLGNSWAAAERAGLPLQRVFPTLWLNGGYSPATYRQELQYVGARASNVWLLESTSDDALRALYA